MVDKQQKIEDFFAKQKRFGPALRKLRSIILNTGMEEGLKWSMPVYMVDGKNVVGIGAFKEHFGVWFFQGALLKDQGKKLINAQEEKTVAMRQWRYRNEEEIDEKLLKNYLEEAIENEKEGKRIKPAKATPRGPKYSEEFQAFLAESKKLSTAYSNLTPGKQREYVEYIIDAKRDSTKQRRMEKIKPMILAGLGLNDKYKK